MTTRIGPLMGVPPGDGHRGAVGGGGDRDGGSDGGGAFPHAGDPEVSRALPVRIEAAAVVGDGDASVVPIDGALDPDDGRPGVLEGVADRLGHDRAQLGGDARARWTSLLEGHDDGRPVGADLEGERVGLLHEARAVDGAQVGDRGAHLLDESPGGAPEGLEVGAEPGLELAALEGHVEAETDGGEGRADLVVQLAGEAGALLTNGTMGDVAQQEDVVEGEGDGPERGLDDPVVPGERYARARPHADLAEDARAEPDGVGPGRTRARHRAATGDLDERPVPEDADGGRVEGNRSGQVAQRGPTDRDRIELGGVRQLPETEEERVGCLEPLEPVGVDVGGLGEGRGARRLLDEDATGLREGEGHERDEQRDLEEDGDGHRVAAGGHQGGESDDGEEGRHPPGAQPRTRRGPEHRDGEREEVGTVEQAGEGDGDEGGEDPRDGDGRGTSHGPRPTERGQLGDDREDADDERGEGYAEGDAEPDDGEDDAEGERRPAEDGQDPVEPGVPLGRTTHRPEGTVAGWRITGFHRTRSASS
jgi:hypothetical protein